MIFMETTIFGVIELERDATSWDSLQHSDHLRLGYGPMLDCATLAAARTIRRIPTAHQGLVSFSCPTQESRYIVYSLPLNSGAFFVVAVARAVRVPEDQVGLPRQWERARQQCQEARRLGQPGRWWPKS
jgi:hypothetical protein